MTLGVLDWGVGGLFAAAHACTRVPLLDVLYRADTGNTPYGLQTRSQLLRSVQAGLNTLASQGATHIVIACHSASTALPDIAAPVPTWGVIDASSVPRGARKILVLGGARTIRSGHWRRVLHRLPGSRQIVQRIAQPLSAHVEAGTSTSAECGADLDRILGPALNADCVVLACTHYAALVPNIAKRMPHTLQIDPAISVVDAVPLQPGIGKFYASTSGDAAALLRAGNKALRDRWPDHWDRWMRSKGDLHKS
ncbi:MAG: glutamate racemase [Myxococcota bacterium]|jgi:glutamate racemase